MILAPIILAIDTGNTTTQFALLRGDKVIHSWRVETGKAVSAAALRREVKKADAHIEGGILGSVVPKENANLKRVFREVTGKRLLVVGEKNIDLGLKVRLKKPEQAGADRLMNAVAGAHFYGTPLIVIDFGTATTFDVVGKDGSYRGGAIAPGIRLSLAALHHKTAKLPLIELKKPGKAIGRDTEEAMSSGIFWGYVGLVEGMVSRIRVELGEKAATVATGGDAAAFAKHTDAIQFQRPDLTLQGLRLVYERNAG